MAELDKVFLMLGEISADQKSMKEDISEIKAQVSEVRDFKIRVVAWCTAASAFMAVIVETAKDSLAHIFGAGSGQ